MASMTMGGSVIIHCLEKSESMFFLSGPLPGRFSFLRPRGTVPGHRLYRDDEATPSSCHEILMMVRRKCEKEWDLGTYTLFKCIYIYIYMYVLYIYI